LGNLHDFDPQKSAVPFEKMDALDQYMLRQTWVLVRDVRKWYDDFAFHKIYHRVNHFCVVELSAFYFDVIKDRLYTYAPNSSGRRSGPSSR
jgi:isoleucyl-tRNA synthetase